MSYTLFERQRRDGSDRKVGPLFLFGPICIFRLLAIPLRSYIATSDIMSMLPFAFIGGNRGIWP